MAIIVVEGIDRVGKTTLVNSMVDWFSYEPQLKFNVFKHDSDVFGYEDMDSDNETDKMIQLIEMVELCDGNIIFDRFHLSEFVYGMCERDYMFSQAYRNMLLVDDKLKKCGAVMVYVKPTSISWSSAQHGMSLAKHNMLMEAAFGDSDMKKVETDFDCIQDDEKREDLIRHVRDRLTDM